MSRRNRTAKLSCQGLESRDAPAADLLAEFPGVSLAGEHALNTDTASGKLWYTDTNQANPSGAAGPAHLVSVVNRVIEWVQKDGTTGKASQSLWRFFNDGLVAAYGTSAGLPPAFDTTTSTSTDNQTPFDPRVVYDPYANRFVVTAAQKGADPTAAASAARVLVAVSKSADPNGGWLFAAVSPQVPDGTVTGTRANYAWVDYPQVAVDNQAVYVTGDLFQSGSTTARLANGSRLWVLPKGTLDTTAASPTYGGYTAGLYFNGGLPGSLNAAGYDPFRVSGDPAAALQSGAVETTLAPALMNGLSQTGPAAAAVFLVGFGPSTAAAATAAEQMQVVKVGTPTGTPQFTVGLVNVGDVDASAGLDPNTPLPAARQLGDVPGGQTQPAAGRQVDAGPHRVSQAYWRGDRLSFAATVVPPAGDPDAGQDTVRWFRVEGLVGNGPPSNYQASGTLGVAAGSQDWTYFPALAEDKYGNLAVGYTGSGPNLAPGAYYAAVATAGPDYVALPARQLHAGTNLSAFVRPDGSGRNRWGDQSSLALDPDGQTFWAFNQYATGPATWGTHWGRFSIVLQPVGSVQAADDNYTSVLTAQTFNVITRPASGGLFVNDRSPANAPLVLASASTQTDLVGNKLVIQPDGGFTFTGNPAVNSGATATFQYNVTNGLTTSTATATFYYSSVYYTITGSVWNDLNGDGLRQPNEPPLAGVTVLHTISISKFDAGRVVTDANGRYSFQADTLTAQYVQVFPPVGTTGTGFTFSPQGVGSREVSSAFNPATGIADASYVTNSSVVDPFNCGLVGIKPWFGWGTQAAYFGPDLQTATDGATVYLAGTFTGTVDFDPGPGTFALTATGGTNRTGFVAAYTADGGLRYARKFADGAVVSVTGVAYTAATSSVTVAGSYRGAGVNFYPAPVQGWYGNGPPPTSNQSSNGGSVDGFVLRVAATDGVFGWFANPYAWASDDGVTALAVDATGIVYSGTTALLGSAPISWLSKTTAAGAASWTHGFYEYSGSSSMAAWVAVDASGNPYYVQQGDTTYNGAVADGKADVVLLAVNPADGNLRWVRPFTSGLGQAVSRNSTPTLTPLRAGGLVVLPGGDLTLGFAIYGGTRTYTYGGASETYTTVGISSDTLLYRVNSSTGATVSVRQLGSGGDNTLDSVQVDAAGNLYLAGTSGGSLDLGGGKSGSTYPLFVGILPATGAGVVRVAAGSAGTLLRASSLAVGPGGEVLLTPYVLGAGSSTVDLDPGPGVYPLALTATNSGSLVRFAPTVFSTVPVATVSGVVWDDRNGNGIMETGEPVITIIPVDLLSGATVLQSTVTDSNGKYSFSGPNAGRLTVRVHPPAARPNPTVPTYTFAPAGAGLGKSGVTDSTVDATGQAIVTAYYGQTATANAGLIGRKAAFGWANQVGGTADTGANAVAVAADGSVYVAGYLDDGTGNFEPGPGSVPLTTRTGATDTYLAKYTKDGALVWARLLVHCLTDNGISVLYNGDLAVASDGGVVVTGIFTGTCGLDPLNPTVGTTANGTGGAAFVEKLTADGAVTWRRVFDTPTAGAGTFVHPGGIGVTASGDVVFTIYTSGTIDFGSGFGQISSSGVEVVRLAGATGANVWRHRMGVTFSGTLALTADSVYTTGLIPGSGDFNPDGNPYVLSTAGGASDYDAYVAKLNLSTGALVWAKLVGSSGRDAGYGVAANGFGVYVGGEWNGSYGFLAKFDPATGTLQWNNVYGSGSSSATVNGVGLDAAGTVYAGGSFNGTVNFDPTASHPLTAPVYGSWFTISVSPARSLRWVLANAGGTDNAIEGLTVDTSGYVYSVGLLLGTTDFDPGPGVFSLTSPSSVRHSGVVFKLYTGVPTEQSNLTLVSGSTAPGTGLNSTTAVRIQGQTSANATVQLLGRTGTNALAPTGNNTVSGQDGSYSLDSPALASFGTGPQVVTLVARIYNAVGDQWTDSDPFTFGVNTTVPTLNGVDVGAASPQTIGWTDTVTTGGQRSQVTNLRWRLGQVDEFVPANLSDAVVVTRTTDGAVIPSSQYTASIDSSSGATYLSIAFTGTQAGLFNFGSLADGRYSVALKEDMVRAITPTGLPAGAPSFNALMGEAGTLTTVIGFFRYFGDWDGSLTVDPVDLFRFRRVMNGVDPYNPTFDYNTDGLVDPIDLFQFRRRFNGILPPP